MRNTNLKLPDRLTIMFIKTVAVILLSGTLTIHLLELLINYIYK